MNSPNVIRHRSLVSRTDRERLNGHRSVALWFTGLSGSGKSTLAHAVEERLHANGLTTYVFDGDNVRHGLCGDLGFSLADRKENLRRIAEMVSLFLDAGVIALTAFISPLRADRQLVRDKVGSEHFVEIYCRCPLEICEAREVKGLYKLAREGVIKNYTGISSPYEEPERPDLVVETGAQLLETSVEQVLNMLAVRGLTGIAPQG
jgi:adenylylsulfate kinase